MRERTLPFPGSNPYIWAIEARLLPLGHSAALERVMMSVYSGVAVRAPDSAKASESFPYSCQNLSGPSSATRIFGLADFQSSPGTPGEDVTIHPLKAAEVPVLCGSPLSLRLPSTAINGPPSKSVGFHGSATILLRHRTLGGGG